MSVKQWQVTHEKIKMLVQSGEKNPVEIFFDRRKCDGKNCPTVVRYKGIGIGIILTAVHGLELGVL